MALYRIVQEALNNVVAHANASRADVSVAFAESEVAVTIHDDGAALPSPTGPASWPKPGTMAYWDCVSVPSWLAVG